MKQQLRIGKRSFLLSLSVLVVLMVFASALSMSLPTGSYERYLEGERVMLVPDSYHPLPRPELPLYRYMTAPIEVLFSEDGLLVVVILLFLLILGGSFSLLIGCGMVERLMDRLTRRFSGKRYQLLFVLSFFFMFFGAAFGVFEELIILVPFSIVLAKRLGWDSLVGLGMSVLSAGLGFSAAIFNPFTLGVAQKIAGLPLYSGFFYRLGVFLSIYLVLSLFLYRYAKKIDLSPQASLLCGEEKEEEVQLEVDPRADGALKVFSFFLLLIPLLLVFGFFLPALSDVLFLVLALVFLLGSLVSVRLSRILSLKESLKIFFKGMLGVAPAILLILMAMSIKLIMTRGLVMDYILYNSVELLKPLSGSLGVVALFVLIMALNFFISSGSAKAFLTLPLLLPLTDLLQINRQIAVQAYLFGDGFSNLLYPTNAALMIALGFTIVGYPKWIRWVFPLQLVLFILSLAWLYLGYFMGLGPF